VDWDLKNDTEDWSLANHGYMKDIGEASVSPEWIYQYHMQIRKRWANFHTAEV